MAQSRPPTTLEVGALFRRVMELRMSFLAILDRRGTVVEVNGAPLRLGYPREAFLGRHIGQTASFAGDPEWVRTWDSRLAEAATLGTPLTYEDVFTGPDGQVRSANATLTPVQADGAAAGGVPDFFLLEADDTTEQLQVELALRGSERHFHDMTEALPVMCWTCDADGVTDYVNARWTDYTGLSAEQLKGWGWTDAIHPDDRTQLASLVLGSLAAGEAFSTDYRVRSLEGECRWFEMRMVPVRDAEGRVVRWYGAASDVHETYTLRSRLERAEAQLEAALGTGAMGRWSADLTTGRFSYDDAVAELCGLEPREASATRFEDFAGRLHPDDREPWVAAMGRAFDPASPAFTLRYRLAHAPERWLESRGRVQFDAAGKPTSLAGVLVDRRGAPPGAA